MEKLNNIQSQIFSNKQNLSFEYIQTKIREQLIDEQYFYPKDWKIKLLDCAHTSNFFTEWYEFHSLIITQCSAGDMDIVELITKAKVKI